MNVKTNKMKKLKLIGLSLALIVSAWSHAFSIEGKNKIPPSNWEKLGSRLVNYKADHDVISVTVHEGFYTKVKFGIRKAPIHLKNINILFGNGENKNVVFNKRFDPGSFTRVIDLPGNKRIIKSIKLNYKTIASGKARATVVAYGKH